MRVFLFWLEKTAGFEGDRAERSEVKTSQCDVFNRESVDGSMSLITPHKTAQDNRKA